MSADLGGTRAWDVERGVSDKRVEGFAKGSSVNDEIPAANRPVVTQSFLDGENQQC